MLTGLILFAGTIGRHQCPLHAFHRKLEIFGISLRPHEPPFALRCGNRSCSYPEGEVPNAIVGVGICLNEVPDHSQGLLRRHQPVIQRGWEEQKIDRVTALILGQFGRELDVQRQGLLLRIFCV